MSGFEANKSGNSNSVANFRLRRHRALVTSTALSLLLTTGVGVAADSTLIQKTNGAAYSHSAGGVVDLPTGNTYEATTTTSSTSNRAWGILVSKGATEPSTLNVSDAKVVTIGAKAHGVQVGAKGGNADGADKSVINLIDSVLVTTNGNDSFGLHAIDGGVINGVVQVETKGKNGFGAFAESYSSISLQDSAIITHGDYGYGIIANNDRKSAGASGGAIDVVDTHITTNGLHAYGAFADNGGKISLTGGSITTANSKGKGTQDVDGSRGYAIYAKGAGSVVSAAGTTIHTVGQRAYGAYAIDGGTVSLNDLAITTEGFMAYGVYASGAGSVLTAENVNITTSGDVGDAGWAYQGGVLNLNGGTYVVKGGPNANTSAGETANGFAALGGVNGTGDGIINASGINLTTYGADSVGLLAGADVGTTSTSGTINLTNSTVNVKGAGSQVANVLYGSKLVVSNSSLVSEQGAGIVLGESATVTLEGTTVKSAGETFVSNFTKAGQNQTITVGNGTVATENNGTLLLVNREAAGADGVVELTLAAGSNTAGNILDEGYKNDGGTDVWLDENASWTGALKGVRNFFGFQGGNVDFDGPVDIAGDLNGNGTSYSFSSQGGTIGGYVNLINGSSTTGGTIKSPVFVHGGMSLDTTSRLGGNWNISGDLDSSGIITPGNSIGHVTVGSDLNLDGTSIYQVEVDTTGDADLIKVGGTARLDGAVVVSPIDGFQFASPYTILTAGTIEGGFVSASLANPSAFLEAKLDQSATDVQLSIERNNTSFASVTETSNQKSVAQTLDRLPLTNPLNAAIALSTVEAANDAFNQLSGDTNASVKTGLIEAAHLTADAINNRLRTAFDGVGTTDVAVIPVGKDVASSQLANDYAVWATGFGSWLNTDGNSNAGGLKTSTGGFISGVDVGFAEGWRVGFAGGYSKTSIHGKGRNASANSDNWHLGIYGGNQWGALGVRAGLIHTWHSVDSSRSVSFTGFNDSLSNSYDARTFQAFGEVGYRIDTASASFEPFANLAHVRLHTDGYTENGGAAALSAGSDNTNTTFSTLGVRVSTPLQLGASTAELKGTMGWVHSYGDRIPVATQAFASSEAFTVQGVPVAKDAFLLEAGLDFAISQNSTLGVSYVGQYGDGVTQNGFNTTLSVKF